MDRRQKKTREAVFNALSTLLETKSYNHITVQEIIDEANIGRSTFYAHFETKDSLLDAMCEEFFGHVFSAVLAAEKHHDFSKDNRTLSDKLTHLLCHLKEQQRDITAVLSSESSTLFIRYFKTYLNRLFEEYADCASSDIPKDFVMNHYVSGFIQAVQWWVGEQMATKPEDLVYYYLSLIK